MPVVAGCCVRTLRLNFRASGSSRLIGSTWGPRNRQVLSKCEEFIGKATFYGSVMSRLMDFKSFVDGMKVFAKRCKALSCESLLVFAHSSCKSAEWQARLIRHQLTEIMIGNVDEKDLHRVLLQSAKNVVDKAGKQAAREAEEPGGQTKAPSGSAESGGKTMPTPVSTEAGGKTKATTASTDSGRKKLRLGSK